MAALGGRVFTLAAADFATGNNRPLSGSETYAASSITIGVAALVANSSLTLPSVAATIAGGAAIGASWDIALVNNGTFPLTVVAGTGWTLVADPAVAIDDTGGVALLKFTVLSATTGEVRVTIINQGTGSRVITTTQTLHAAKYGPRLITAGGGALVVTLSAAPAGTRYIFMSSGGGGTTQFVAPAPLYGKPMSTNTTRLGNGVVTAATITNTAGDQLEFRVVDATHWEISGAAASLTLA